MNTQTKLTPDGRAARVEEPAALGAKLPPSAAGMSGIASDVLRDVQVSLETYLGGAELTVQELLDLKSGSIVKLDLRLNELVELRLQGSVVARGEIVAVGDHFGVRILEIGKAR